MNAFQLGTLAVVFIAVVFVVKAGASALVDWIESTPNEEGRKK